jgi:hypothetical protein
VQTGPVKVLASPAWVIQESDSPIMGGAVDNRWPRRVADHLTVGSRKPRNPSQKMTARTRRAPDTLTRRRERIAGIHGLSIDTIELYQRNMI